MPRFYLYLSVILILLLALCGYTLRVLGSIQPVHPALRGFVEGCEGLPQPCWYGIVPGMTSYMQTDVILRNRGFKAPLPLTTSNPYTILTEGCNFEANVTISGVKVDGVRLSPCTGVRTGDVLTVLGDYPDTIWGNCIGEIVLTRGPFLIYTTDTFIESEVAAVLLYDVAYGNLGGLGVPWHGFGRYNDLGDAGCG